MARPQRHNVDYFPHYISDGKKMFIIESKFGNDGYAMWFKILEILAKTDDHWIDLKDESNLMFLSAKCKVDESVLIEFINAVVKLGEFDCELWNEQKVIWSSKFIESVEDAYRKRNNVCMNRAELIQHLMSLGRNLLSNGNTKGGDNPQSKVEYSIVDETIEEELASEIQEIKKCVKPKDRIPSLESFIDYGLEQAAKNKLNVTRTALSMKYEAWKEAGWVNGNGQEVKNWKSSLINTLPHIKSEPIKEHKKFVPRPPVFPKQL